MTTERDDSITLGEMIPFLPAAIDESKPFPLHAATLLRYWVLYQLLPMFEWTCDFLTVSTKQSLFSFPLIL